MISIRSLRLLLVNAIVVLICSPVVASAAAPTGYLDEVRADGVALGWALDPDTSSQSIQMHFYIDGPAGQGTLVGVSTANVLRADVNTTMSVTGDHGFSFQIPATYVGGSHKLYAYAIDSSGTGENPNLSGSPKTFTITASNTGTGDKLVVGNFEQVANDGTVSGWAFDPDAPSQTIDIHVYSDAPAGQGTLVAISKAAIARPDVNTAYGITGAHGFKISIPRHLINDKSHPIYVYGIDTKAGTTNPLLLGSPRTVTIPAQTQSSLGNVSISANGITIKTTARLAGAIDSLVWNGKEFVDSGDHGRQIQTAWTGNDYGECFNPTEAGSAADGSGQYSTSQLLSLTSTSNSLTTTGHPAFWQTPGTHGEGCYFDNNPADQWLGGATVNSTNQTRSTLQKTVTIGVPGLSNVIEYISRITLDAQELAQVPLKHIILENPAVYMPTEFKRIYRVDTAGALVELGPNQPNFNKFLFDPVILATEDGKYALGLYSDEIPRVGYSHSVQKGYVGYGIYNWGVAMGMDTRAPKLPTNGSFFTTGTYTYKSYLAVGTLEEVRAAIIKLSAVNPASTVVGTISSPPTTSPFSGTNGDTITSSPAAELTTSTINALQVQIQVLLARIKALQTQINTTALVQSANATVTASCPNLTRNLSRGSRGTDVTQLQQFLISQNLLASDSATGFFGAMTEAVVKQFQCSKMNICSGSPSTNGYGAVGPRTRAAIATACITPATPKPSTTPVTPTASTVPTNPTVPTTPTTPPPSASCTPLAPQTQTLSCPSGQTGSITQTRTSSCADGAVSPVWGGWLTIGDTCATTERTTVSDLFAGPSQRSSQCPLESAWPSTIGDPYPDIYAYNQCYSTEKNWDQISIPDYVLSYKDYIKVQFSTALAGAIASIKVGGVEYIASPGHGSAFTYNLHPTVPSKDWCPPDQPNCYASECYNPTEEGSEMDDYRDSSGSPANGATWANFTNAIGPATGQRHGPSSSAILGYPDTHWQGGIVRSAAPYAWFRTSTRLANFIPFRPGFSSASQCITHYQDILPFNAGLSRYFLDKEVRLGVMRSRDGHVIAEGYPILAFNTTMSIEQPEPKSPRFDTVLIAYLMNEFETYYRIPQGCNSADCLVNISGSVLGSISGVSNTGGDPYIVARNKDYAIGAISVKPSGIGWHNEPTYWSYHSNGGAPATWASRLLQVTFYSGDIDPTGTVTYRSYYAMGKLDDVARAINDIRLHPDVAW